MRRAPLAEHVYYERSIASKVNGVLRRVAERGKHDAGGVLKVNRR